MFPGLCSGVQFCPALREPLEYSPPGSSVQGIFQEQHWSGLRFPSTGALPHPGIKPRVSCTAGGFFTAEPSRRPHSTLDLSQEAETRSCGENSPIHDIFRHLYVEGSQILWVHVCACTHVCVYLCACVCACMFRALLLPLPPFSGRKPGLSTWELGLCRISPQQHPCCGRDASLGDSEKSLGMFSTQRAPSGP